jgi:hypothetical protein
VAIYSTLGLARTLIDGLGSKFLSVWLFLLGFILVLATVIIKVWSSGIDLGIAVACLLIFVRVAIPTDSRIPINV